MEQIRSLLGLSQGLMPESWGPPVSSSLSIFGLSPGMTRAQVWERKGAPLGGWSYGQADSATATPVPEWVATDVTSRTVWHYGRFAAIFRGSKLVQVLGEQIEWSVVAGEAYVFRGQRAWELLNSKVPRWMLRPVSAVPGSLVGSPLVFRLFPHNFDLSIRPLADSLMRNRLEKSVGLLKVSDQHSQIFVADNSDPRSWYPELWLQPSQGGWRFTLRALRRALWECLHYGPDYLAAARDPKLTTLWLLLSKDKGLSPGIVRHHLIFEAFVRHAGLAGRKMDGAVCLNNLSLVDCANAWERLMLVGHGGGPGQWCLEPGGKVFQLLQGGMPTQILRVAAGQALCLDLAQEGRRALPPESDVADRELDLALSGGKSYLDWTSVGGFRPGGAWNWLDRRHRFHVLWTPEKALVSPFDQDRLAIILQAQQQLAQLAWRRTSNWPVHHTTSNWGDSLGHHPAELEMLEEIERFPHQPLNCQRLAIRMRRLAKMAMEWLPNSPTREQRWLAAGVLNVLTLGLEIQGVAKLDA